MSASHAGTSYGLRAQLALVEKEDIIMFITCPRCQTVFRLSTAMLPADTSSVKVKCSHCQMVFSLPETLPPEEEYKVPDPPVIDEVAAQRPDDSFEVPEVPATEIETDIAAETEEKDDGAEPEIHESDETQAVEPQELSGDDLVDPGAGVEDADGEPGEVVDPDGENADEAAAEDIVFELADDFEDDLSWAIDDDNDDHEMTTASESEQADTGEERQTVMDKEGLFPAEADDDKKEAKMSGKAMPMSDSDDLPTAAEGENPAAAKTVKVHVDRRRTFLFLGLIFLVLSLAVWGGMLIWQKFSIDMEKHLSIVGLESRSYIFPSGKRVIAIQGKIYNTSPKVVGKLRIKGVIVDRQGKLLAQRVTSGGVTFSADELQNLDEKMVEKLENPAAIVPAKGGKLPFMLVFYGFPPSASNYHVELEAFSVLKKGKKS